jgi:ATP-dependent protease ClpP protease subunit
VSLIWCGPIDDRFAETFLRYREKEDCEHHLILKSPGGDAGSFFTVYDVMKWDGDWLVRGTGEVASAAVLLVASGKRRVLTPNTRLMLHRGIIDPPSGLNASSLRGYSQEMNWWEEQIYKILAKATHASMSTWMKRLAAGDLFLSAEEAVNLHLADAIIFE